MLTTNVNKKYKKEKLQARNNKKNNTFNLLTTNI